MKRTIVAVAAALLALAPPVLAASITTTTPNGWCTVNPGLERSSVVCDYAGGFSPRYGRNVRVRVLLELRRHGSLRCAISDVYDPTIPTILQGRILETTTRCYSR
jgi:hypothetical protein